MIPNPATTPSTPEPQPLRLQSPQPQWVPGNPQSASCKPQSDIPHSAFRIPHSDSLQSNSLHARGLALFSTLMAMVEIILIGVVDLLAGSHHLSNAKALPLLDKAIRCLFSLGRLHLTLQRAPHYFTARQILRLAQAFEKIRYLTGRAFDFSPWTSLTPDQLASQQSPSPSPSQSSGNPQSSICNLQSGNPQSSPAPKKALSPTQFIDNLQLAINNPQSAKPQPVSQAPKNPQSAICNPQSSTATPAVPATPATPPVAPVPNVNAVPAATVTATPGATLARICEDLVELAEALGLPHTFETGFLPVLSPSPAQSSGNLQSTICNQQSGTPHSDAPSVHPVNPVNNVNPVNPVQSVHSPSPAQSEILNLKSEIPLPHSTPPP